MYVLAEEKVKAPALTNTEPLKVLGCILTTRPLAIIGLIFLPDKHELLGDTLPLPSPLNHPC